MITQIDSLNMPGWMPRFYYSHYHIMAAAFFARECGRIEREHSDKDPVSTKVFTEHRAFVTGCIFSAVSFLEAQINEIFTDAADDQRNFIHQLGDKIYLFAEMWKLEVPKTASYSILKKYEIALALAQVQPLDRGSLSYQNVNLLIGLRNRMIHYEPASANSDAKASQDYERKFHGRFPPNPLTGSRTPFFPERCMGYGCAKWAVEASVNFVEHFCTTMEIIPVYDLVRDSLKVE